MKGHGGFAIFVDPFAGNVGPKKSWAAHVPLEANTYEALAIGASQVYVNDMFRLSLSNGDGCGCK